MRSSFRTLFLLALCLAPFALKAQPVSVTLTLDTNRLVAGQSTVIRVFAQITPENRPTTDRIFSWYVDVVNETPTVARADWLNLQKNTSDKDPRISSFGFGSEAIRSGIYDTFMNRPGAGRDEPVELLAVPIIATGSGTARFRVRHGTGVAHLSSDFIVAPLGGGDPLLGGDYSQASVELGVVGALAVSRAAVPEGTRISINYAVLPGQNHFIEWRDSLNPLSPWSTAEGGPHNAGTFTETNALPTRFYRLRIE